MQKNFSFITVASAVLATTVLLQGDPAHACGGCFAPPATVQTVTDHRMVLSLSSQQTTLWDQFSYTGSPETFSWILPVRSGPDVQLNLADDRFLTALDNLTAPQITRPTPPRGCSGSSFGVFAGPPSRSAGEEAPVTMGVQVFREDVVGPYAIAVIGGNDAMAIRTWLTDNGFSVPPAVVPVINYYVGIRSDFLALKLRAGASINRMNPVRVTIPGYAPTLPLRMVSAGVSDKVALNLIVLGTTRFQAANFPNGEISDRDLTWDWNANPPQDPVADFRSAQRRLLAQMNNQAWITESSTRNVAANLQAIANSAEFAGSRDGQPPTPVCPPPNMMQGMQCNEPSPRQDMNVALTGLIGAPNDNVMVTRLRAELPSTALDRDLQLVPASGERPVGYRYGNILNAPRAPVCENPGPARGTQTAIQCSTIPGVPAGVPQSVLLAMTAVSAAFAARKRQRRA